MITCNYENKPTEFETFRFCIDASELGIAPGAWPRTIATDIGNGQPFVFVRAKGEEAVIYRQQLGCIELHVIND